MSWIQVLNDTYDRVDRIREWELNEKIESLLSIGSLYMLAQLTITLSPYGEFLRAEIESKEMLTQTPCTEDSACSRTSSKAATSPHLLVDKLCYFAGDGSKYEPKKAINFESLMMLHKEFGEAVKLPNSLLVLRKYLEKKSVIEDLIAAGVLIIDAKGKLEWNKARYTKTPKKAPLDTVVRWIVQEPDTIENALWKRQDIMELWRNYYVSHKSDRGYCQVTGKVEALACNHPKNINPSDGNAKLISSKDDGCKFKYKGRFISSEEVNQIGYVSSQKIHHAMRYLLQNHGTKLGSTALMFWSKKKMQVPDPQGDLDDLFGSIKDLVSDDLESDVSIWFDKRLKGYGAREKPEKEFDQIYIMCIEAVTNGRMSITYFREFDENDYIKRLLKWHKSCSWLLNYKWKSENGENKRVRAIGTPSIPDIIKTVYGRPKDSNGKGTQVNEALFLSARERLLHCILDDFELPKDMVKLITNQVCNRVRYHDQNDFDKALCVACALINKEKYDRTKEAYSVALDHQRKTRDYLYGRLLAVAQNIESWSMKDSKIDFRMTNADRLMQRFSQRPFSTWKTIELSMKPYQERLGKKAVGLTRLIDEIMSLFDPEDYLDDHPLSGEFLIGYHCQRQAFYNRVSKNNSQENEEEIQA